MGGHAVPAAQTGAWMLAGALGERRSGAFFQKISLELGGIRELQAAADVMDLMSLRLHSLLQIFIMVLR